MAIIKNPLTIIKVTGGQDEPSSDAKLLSYDRTTGVITGTGLGTTGTLYLLDRDTHSYVAQPTSSWSGTQITLTTPLDLEHLEGSTSIVAVTSAGWSTKLLVKGDVAVSGWAKLYLQNPDTRAIYTITIDNQTDFAKLYNSSNYYANQITIGETVFYRDEIVGIQLGEDFGLTDIGGYFLALTTNLNQPLDFSGVTAIGGVGFLNGCSSFNQPIDLSSVTSIYNNFLSSCTSFDQPLDFPSVTSLGHNFLSGCRSFNQSLKLSSVTSIYSNFLTSCTSFNQPLDLSSVTSIGEYFLNGCSSFNQPIDLSSITSTKQYFLQNCYSFNQTLDLSSVTSVGTNFLNSCYSFNQPLDLSSVTSVGTNFLQYCYSFNQPVDLPSVTSIASYFLNSCYSFNQPLDLSSVTSVGEYFLNGCSSFNQPIDLSSVTSVGNYFLFTCYSFSNLTVGANTASPTDNYSLTPNQNMCKMYVKGVTITGAGASTWVANLPNKTSSPYRNLIDGTA